MARRNAQLFEVLGARYGGGGGGGRRGGGRPRSSGRGGRGAGSAMAAGRSFLDWFQSRVGGGRPASTPLADAGIRSAILFGGAAAMLAIGFLIGRWSVGDVVRPEGDPLRRAAAVDGSGAGQEPDLVRPTRLTAAQEEAVLSDFGYVLLAHGGAGETGRAGPARLARWLRDRGISNARILRTEHRGQPAWLAVVYTAKSGQPEQQMLAGLEAPAFFQELGSKYPWDALVGGQPRDPADLRPFLSRD